MSMFSLAGKTAVITGSTRGIGKAIAERMAEAGANVVISSRKPEACAAVAAAIGATHGAGRAIAIPASISSKDELRHLVDETVRQLGKIDILVCNAASNPYFGPMAGARSRGDGVACESRPSTRSSKRCRASCPASSSSRLRRRPSS